MQRDHSCHDAVQDEMISGANVSGPITHVSSGCQCDCRFFDLVNDGCSVGGKPSAVIRRWNQMISATVSASAMYSVSVVDLVVVV